MSLSPSSLLLLSRAHAARSRLRLWQWRPIGRLRPSRFFGGWAFDASLGRYAPPPPPPSHASPVQGAPQPWPARETRRQRRHRLRDARADPHAEAVGMRAALADCTYEFSRGADGAVLRGVRPYWATHSCTAPPRVWGRSLLDVYVSEYGRGGGSVGDEHRLSGSVAFPEAYWGAAIEAGMIRLERGGDEVRGADAVLREGDRMLHTHHKHEPPVTMEPGDDGRLRLVDLDRAAGVVAVHKPASVPVHPSGAFRFNTVYYMMYADHGIVPRTVHRLDRATSGVLLMGLSKPAARRLTTAIGDKGRCKKTYLARVCGRLGGSGDWVDVRAPLAIQRRWFGSRKSNTVAGEGGTGVEREAHTRFRLVAYDEAADASIVECRPLSGRTHQLRLHLAHIGHPIVDDVLYNEGVASSRVAAPLAPHGGDELCHVCSPGRYGVEATREQALDRLSLHAWRYEVDGRVWEASAPEWTGQHRVS